MASRLFARRQQPKKATILISKQTLEKAVQEANTAVSQLIETNVHDKRIEQLEESIDFLNSILKKSPAEMQQDGVATLDDYLDNAVKPDIAQKIQQDVNMIAKIKTTVSGLESVTAGAGFWVNDRDEQGEPKTPELAEVPRVAYSKNADLFYGNKEAAPVIQMPSKSPAAPARPVAPAPADADADVNPDADIKQLSSDVLAKLVKALSTAEDLMNDKAANRFIGAIADELADRPVEADKDKDHQEDADRDALPIAASFFGGLKLVAAEKKVAVTPPGISEELMHKLKKEYPGDEEAAYATAWKIHNDKNAAIKVLNAAAKAANGQGGSWFYNDGDTGHVKENSGHTPEISEAHSKLEDNTHIDRPETVLPSKFAAGDMTTGKALKVVERLSNELRSLYFEAKPVTEVLDSRPVREAVEAIYRAYDMMGEAAKVLNKQRMQEQAEEQALEVKDKNKSKKSSSVLFGLTLAADEAVGQADDEEDESVFSIKKPTEWEELAEKKKNNKPPVFHKKEKE